MKWGTGGNGSWCGFRLQHGPDVSHTGEGALPVASMIAPRLVPPLRVTTPDAWMLPQKPGPST
jgi:hypothetical protein